MKEWICAMLPIFVPAALIGAVWVAAAVYESQVTEVGRDPIGNIVDVRAVETSWNDAVVSELRTTEMVLTISGRPSVRLGAKAWSIKLSDGRKYVTWDGEDRMYAY